MKKRLNSLRKLLGEAKDPAYYQNTFYFTILISMHKEVGGSRDETKNDIRAISEVLTVTLVEATKGGIQRDLGTKYLSTLKLHVRRPKNVSKAILMKKLVLRISNLRGVSVLRYKEHRRPRRRKRFVRKHKLTELDYQKERRKKRGQYSKMKKRLISLGPQKEGGAPFTRRASTERSPSPPAEFGGSLEEKITPVDRAQTTSIVTDIGDAQDRFDRLYEDILITIKSDQSDLMAFDLQPHLQPKIWDGEEKIQPQVKNALMEIVEEFLEDLDIGAEVENVVVTGSMANYNWSKFSDIDIHIIFNFADINENKKMVKKFFDSVRSNWNKLHNIRVKGHEVEIYVQDSKEPHVSTGVYSLLDDEWIVKSQRVSPYLDKRTATKKMKQIAREIDKLSAIYDSGNFEEAFSMAKRVKTKIKRMRQAGLHKFGIYAPENLAFKMLRRSGDIEQLFSIYTQAYDKIYSLDQ